MNGVEVPDQVNNPPENQEKKTASLKPTHLEVLEQVVHARIDIERVEPERKHPRLAFALGVKLFNHRSLVLFERFEARPRVEQVGDECEVELGVAGDEGRGGQVLAATDRVGVLEDLEKGGDE